ncbi:putative enzyme (plasmid) [Rhodovastum atsumiense]|uniref:glycosyltransferase n=1 Tax=Rhodovastum atsumiense TaxID=504468 RepID=UPI002023E2F2|nr:glycosyltransferase [Rhodovastum atsumiense]CAH2605512.1 putative enzyme [Rhodovastum atsumiense]
MRLVIDLQGAQGLSRNRGIGRLSRELARAMVRSCGNHEPVILLNEALAESADELAGFFATILPRENIRSWHGLTGCAEVRGGNMARRRTCETIRAQVLAGLDPDLVHVTSVVEGAGEDVVTAWPAGLQRLPVVATFYDAIPLIRAEDYLRGPWRDLRGWYLRHVQELRHCEALLAISESSRGEAIDHVGCNPERVFNIRAGFNRDSFRPTPLPPPERTALLTRHGLRTGFVLFIGAGDIRKNDRRLVEAYAMLPAALRLAHQLVIVGSWEAERVRARAEALGVTENDLVLLRHVPETDLPLLYSACHVFVMPSEHEGFGLPALEAMACGAPVIASNTTSLPEVVGLEEALFDPYEPASIARKLQQVLTDGVLRERLAVHGLARSAEFGWDTSARRAWSALEEVLDRRALTPQAARGQAPFHRPGAPLSRKPKLAHVGPLPPDASGIADYSRDLLPELARHYDITLVTQSGRTDDDTLCANFPVIDEATFDRLAHRFDRILYQIGNSRFHSGIVETLLPRHPGVAMLHDAFLGNIPLHRFLDSQDRDELARTLFDSHGWPAIRALAGREAADVLQRFPCSLPVFRHALGVIQHSAHARTVAARHIGPAAAAMVRLIPHLGKFRPRHDRAEARARLNLPKDAPVICSFGIVAETKCPETVLAAWQVALADQPQARLALVGAVAPEHAEALRRQATRLGVQDRFILTGRVDDDTYRLWLDASDIAVQLRRESRGETSGAIIDCMASLVPVVANAHGSAAELPPEAVLLLPDAATVPAIAAGIAELWARPDRRAALAEAALAWLRATTTPVRIAAMFHDAIEAAYVEGDAARLFAATPGSSAAALPAVTPAVDPCLREEDLPDAARALTRSFPPALPRRLLFDVTDTMDGASDAARNIPEIVRHALLHAGPGCIVEMMYMDGPMPRHARAAAARLLGLPLHGLVDAPVSIGPGDTLVVMAGHATFTAEQAAALRRLRRQGAHVVVMVDALATLQHPQPLPSGTRPARRQDGQGMLRLADAALCFSREVAETLMAWLDSGETGRHHPLDLGWLHPASSPRRADEASGPAMPDGMTALLASLAFGPWPLRWSPRPG